MAVQGRLAAFLCWKKCTAPLTRAQGFPSNDQSTVITFYYTFCRGVAVYPPSPLPPPPPPPRALRALGESGG